MAASLDGLRARWERMNPREQRLVVALSLTLVVALIFGMVAKIQSGMKEIEEKNADSRSALLSLASYRNSKAQAADSDRVKVDIPDTAVALDTYIEGIISELQLTSPTYPALKEEPKGEYVELSFRISIKDLDLIQTTQLLEKIETGSKLVVVKELNIDRNFRDKEKLNLDMTVATYQKKKKEKEKEKGKKNDEEDDEGEDS